jgi:hypothetical protein
VQRPEALAPVLTAIGDAVARGAPATLLVLASHATRRGSAWPRRVFLQQGQLLRAWGRADARAPLRADAIAAITGAARGELLARAEARRHFPRAVIDRALIDLPVARGAWPRGSELALPDGGILRLVLHTDGAPELAMSVALFDERWHHVGDLAGSATQPGAPLGVELDLEHLLMRRVRHGVMVVFGHLPRGFVGLAGAQRDVEQRFDVVGRSRITVPLALDFGERRLRWLDGNLAALTGGYRAALGQLGRDLADFVAPQARPTLWDLACIHAAARANLVYVRERDRSFTTYRRRDREPALARLGRLISGTADSFRITSITNADAPTWCALVTGDLALPPGSAGYALDGGSPMKPDFARLTATELVAELVPRA